MNLFPWREHLRLSLVRSFLYQSTFFLFCVCLAVFSLLWDNNEINQEVTQQTQRLEEKQRFLHELKHNLKQGRENLLENTPLQALDNEKSLALLTLLPTLPLSQGELEQCVLNHHSLRLTGFAIQTEEFNALEKFLRQARNIDALKLTAFQTEKSRIFFEFLLTLQKDTP